MLKMRINSIFLVVSITVSCIFSACKKIDTRPVSVNISEVKIGVQKWYTDFSKTATTKEAKLADSIVKYLDYESSTKIVQKNGNGVLYMVGISDMKKHSKKFNALGITFKDNKFSLEGIFQITSLTLVSDFYLKGTISVNDSILVLSLKNYPLYGWTKRANGLVVKLTGISLPKGTKPTLNNLANSQVPKSLYMQQPVDEPCVDHFVIYSNTSTGQIIDIVQLPSTGNCAPNDGSQGSGGGPTPSDSCASTQAANATNFANNNSQFITSKDSIITAASDGKEHAIRFGKDANGNIVTSTMSSGTNTSGTISSVTNSFGDIHNHINNLPPSAGDLYGLMKLYQGNSKYLTRYIVTGNGTVYALVVTDATSLGNFLNQYPSIHISGYSPEFPDALLDNYNNIYQEQKFSVGDQVANEMALAYVLDTYNVGVALLKQDTSGTFRKLNTTTTIIGGNTTYTQKACN